MRRPKVEMPGVSAPLGRPPTARRTTLPPFSLHAAFAGARRRRSSHPRATTGFTVRRLFRTARRANSRQKAKIGWAKRRLSSPAAARLPASPPPLPAPPAGDYRRDVPSPSTTGNPRHRPRRSTANRRTCKIRFPQRHWTVPRRQDRTNHAEGRVGSPEARVGQCLADPQHALRQSGPAAEAGAGDYADPGPVGRQGDLLAEPLLEKAYLVRQGETLPSIADHYRVPPLLLAKITDPRPAGPSPGKPLKVVQGPSGPDQRRARK